MKSSSSAPTKPSKASRNGITLRPYFHKSSALPFDTIPWNTRKVDIKDEHNKVIFSQPAVEAPVSWSDLAVKIAASKYFYGDIANGTDPKNGGRENSIRELVSRVVDTIADWGKDDRYFRTAKDAETFRRELSFLCVNQYGAFNSPVWFNVGLFHKYGVGKTSTRGNHVYDPKNGRTFRPNSQYEFPQCSACFIQHVDDDMESILRLAASEAMLFKFGSGTGSDLSTLRSTREKLSGGGKPSGPMSFLKVYDQIAGTIKSGGKTRRAAKMNTLKTWHPDIEEFILAKQTEERKAWTLIDGGYDGSFNGDAYGSVMYQNENLSVRASDEFMNAAIAGVNFWTKAVTTGLQVEEKNAGKLLDLIAEGTHICGDPGMQFDDTIDAWHTCRGTARQNSTNPCSEYLFLDDTACNLASLNLLKFKNEDGSFNAEAYAAACRIFIIAQDIVVDRSSYPTEPIAINSHIFRTLGLGYANLGSLIMSYGFGYDSDEGRSLAGAITALMTGTAYETSAELAEFKGAFEGYHTAKTPFYPNPISDSNAECMLEVMRKHRAALSSVTVVDRNAELLRLATIAWDNAIKLGTKYGYRNAQVTVLAPTGTIGFLMDCATTGIEPAIALVAYKTLAGGGMLKLVNSTVPLGLKSLGYTGDQIGEVLAYIKENDSIEGAPYVTATHTAVFDCAFAGGKGTRSLGYMGHLRMMAACQPFLSGAISKTVNLPESATIADIRETYIASWKMGLKAVAIYRDNSKRSAPLTTKKADLTPALEVAVTVAAAPTTLVVHAPRRRRLPDTRDSRTHKFEVGGHEGYIIIGMFDDGTPGEVFINMSKEGSTIGGLMDTIGIMLSMSLQSGVPLSSLVRKFEHSNFEPSGFTRHPKIKRASSIIDYIVRYLDIEFGEGAVRPAPRTLSAPIPEGDIAPVSPLVPLLPITERRIEVGALSLTAVAPVAATNGRKHDDGSVCHKCGSSEITKTGTCGVCRNCGESQGCS
jgi:ribonucleoside-diphosphate reductase alpha chain